MPYLAKESLASRILRPSELPQRCQLPFYSLSITHHPSLVHSLHEHLLGITVHRETRLLPTQGFQAVVAPL